MTKKQKLTLLRIFISAAAVVLSFVVHSGAARPVLLAAAYAAVAYDVLHRALKGVLRGGWADENLLMSVASLGAILTREYVEAVAVLLFYQTGELFQDYAVQKSRNSIATLMDICTQTANVLRGDEVCTVAPDEVGIGETLVIYPGERVPIDGVVTLGSSALDMSALTGESLPADVSVGKRVISGSINLSGVLHIRTECEYADSTVQKILELIESSGEKKTKIESFITRFARVYTPAVMIFAALFAALSPVFLGGGIIEGVRRALVFLVVSCPCALVISVPMTYFCTIGAASKIGVLIKGAACIEALSRTKTLVFDKTGTLTQGVFDVVEICAKNGDKSELLALAAAAESSSAHPIAESIKKCGDTHFHEVTNSREIAGEGIIAEIGGDEIFVGNMLLIRRAGAQAAEVSAPGTAVHVSRGSEYLGYIVISDKIKPDAADAIVSAKAQGITKTVILTGDGKTAAESAAAEIGADEVFSQLLPADKVAALEKIISQNGTKSCVAYIGDGINDAPVLARADVGIAMGGIGSDAAIEAADAVVMDDNPAKIATAIKLSRRCTAIVRQNVAFSRGIKALAVLLGALGLAGMWAAVFADVGVAMLAVFNAMRAMKK